MSARAALPPDSNTATEHETATVTSYMCAPVWKVPLEF